MTPSRAPGRRGAGCALALGAAVVVGVALTVATVGWQMSEGPDEEPRRVSLRIEIQNSGEERVETRYVLHLGARDAEALGVPREIPDRFGTFDLRTSTEVDPEDIYTACLEEEASITLDDVDVGSVPAGTCMTGGASIRTAEVRVRT
jgi:hypothetical protein